eukprot:5308470-Heterocapsa_arctica.AAC.1
MVLQLPPPWPVEKALAEDVEIMGNFHAVLYAQDCARVWKPERGEALAGEGVDDADNALTISLRHVRAAGDLKVGQPWQAGLTVAIFEPYYVI